MTRHIQHRRDLHNARRWRLGEMGNLNNFTTRRALEEPFQQALRPGSVSGAWMILRPKTLTSSSLTHHCYFLFQPAFSHSNEISLLVLSAEFSFLSPPSSYPPPSATQTFSRFFFSLTAVNSILITILLLKLSRDARWNQPLESPLKREVFTRLITRL